MVTEAQFSKAGDPHYFWTERAVAPGEDISLTWYEIGEPLLIHTEPNTGGRRYGVCTLLIPALSTRLNRNGVEAKGKSWPTEREGRPFSTSALAFSESWTDAREGGLVVPRRRTRMQSVGQLLSVQLTSVELAPTSHSVESRMGAVAWGRWPTPRFPSLSRPGEFHPEPLTDPDVRLSPHPARATQRRLAPSGETAGFLRSPVDPTNAVSDPPPSLHRHYPAFVTTMGRSAPDWPIGTFGLAGPPLEPFPLAWPTRVSSSIRKPK
jgi:hypothetical protein